MWNMLYGVDKPVGVSEFTLSSSLPKALRDKLPDAKELEKEILRQMDKSDETD